MYWNVRNAQSHQNNENTTHGPLSAPPWLTETKEECNNCHQIIRTRENT